ncbi:hypothetical protein, partial [Salmonella sp. SAL4445]|uniref:hypothetical protein n=1 Tax=Salmonella sp. SAL4445 TaxID=3159900 RepID=UPI003979E26C
KGEYNETGETITSKDEITKRGELYLKKNHVLNVNGFIHKEMNYLVNTSFIRDVAYGMVESGKYYFAETDVKDEWLI